MNSDYKIYRTIPTQDVATAIKIANELDAKIYVISKIIFKRPDWATEQLAISSHIG